MANLGVIPDGAGTPLVRRHRAACLGARLRIDVRWSPLLPDHVNIDQILVTCRDQASVSKVHRRS